MSLGQSFAYEDIVPISASVTPVVTSQEYTSKEDFLAGEGKYCLSATDGVNTFTMKDGEIIASTQMAYIGDETLTWKCLQIEAVNPIFKLTQTYSNQSDYIAAEGNIADRATDGVNTFAVDNGVLTVLTKVGYTEGQDLTWETTRYKYAGISRLSQNDKVAFNTLLGRSSDKEKSLVAGVVDKYEAIENGVPQDEKSALRARFLEIIDAAKSEISLKTPADTAMTDSDYAMYTKLSLLGFEIRILP